jgi:hypothetical protein
MDYEQALIGTLSGVSQDWSQPSYAMQSPYWATSDDPDECVRYGEMLGLELVRGQVFVGQTIDIRGKHFHQCEFIDCMLSGDAESWSFISYCTFEKT